MYERVPDEYKKRTDMVFTEGQKSLEPEGSRGGSEQLGDGA